MDINWVKLEPCVEEFVDFYGTEEYAKDERQYKRDLSSALKTILKVESIEQDGFKERFRDVLKKNGNAIVNLVGSGPRVFPFLDCIESMDEKSLRSIYKELVHGSGDVFDRVSAFAASYDEYATKNGFYKITLGLASLFIAYYYSDQLVMYKGQYFKKFWDAFIEGAEYAGKPLNKYRVFNKIAQELLDKIKRYQPERFGDDQDEPDMTDVQAFIYLCNKGKIRAGSAATPGPTPTVALNPLVADILRLLEVKRQVILYGPPGTSKTFFAKLCAEELTGVKATEAFPEVKEGQVKNWPVGILGPDGAKNFDEFKSNVEAFVTDFEAGGEIAIWWSFDASPFREALEEEIKKRGNLSLFNTVKGKAVARWEVLEFQASKTPVKSPWPNITPEEWRDKVSISDRKPGRFRTWFRCRLPHIFETPVSVDSFWNVKEDKAFRPRDINQEVFRLIKYPPDILPQGFEADQIEIVQFHPSYTYEDFVRGLVSKPAPEGGVTFGPEDKVFAEICGRAEDHDDRKYVLIIDEINRADMAKVLGELIYGLEYREPVSTPYPDASGSNELSIPANLYVIGTMNTADKSIALIDYALRRRFAFYPMFSSRVFVDDYYDDETYGDTKLAALNLFDAVASCFAARASDLQVGHTYFMVGVKRQRDERIYAAYSPKNSAPLSDDDTYELLKYKFVFEIAPLIREYIDADEQGVTAEAIAEAHREPTSAVNRLSELFEEAVAGEADLAGHESSPVEG